MNIDKLREAETLFFQLYPGGFEDPALADVRRRHNVDRLSQFAATALAKPRFVAQGQVLEDIVRIVTRSSMVSMFEKPKFRDYVNALPGSDRDVLADGYRKLLHGNQQAGFEQVLEVLAAGQLAKWSLMTIVGYQYRPLREVFVKPTTTRNTIRRFELEGLEYKARPSWAFYAGYRAAIERMKQAVHPGLSPSNAAFTGFLMITSGEIDR